MAYLDVPADVLLTFGILHKWNKFAEKIDLGYDGNKDFDWHVQG